MSKKYLTPKGIKTLHDSDGVNDPKRNSLYFKEDLIKKGCYKRYHSRFL